MPNRLTWEPGFSTGHGAIDAQHQALLDQCNRLADLCAATGNEDSERAFDLAFEQLEGMAREHFEAEAAWLASVGDPALEDHRADCDEFDYLADQIATTDHFDRLELQRFLALWWLGHIAGSAPRFRALLASGQAQA
jgi:hemerythrin-like metal-binding protein